MKEMLHLNKEQQELYFDAIDLLSKNFPESRTMQEFYLNPESHIERIIVAFMGRKVVAALKRGHNPIRDALTIDFIAVDELYRYQGIGKFLLAEFENFVKQKGNNRIGLYASRTSTASEFYKKQGYIEVPSYRLGWMEKEL